MTSAVPGRVVIKARAYEKVFATLAADEFGVAASAARVKVSDDGGLLSAAVVSAAAAGGTTIVERVGRARARITGEGARLTGATLSEVRVRIDEITHDARRVR